MTKEKFVFELIDNYLYTECLSCMVLENYLLEDRTEDYINCADRFRQCINFFDDLDECIKAGKCEEALVDAALESLIFQLKQETVRTTKNILKKEISPYVLDAEDFMDNYLQKDITKEEFLRFMKQLREKEMEYAEENFQ